MLTLSYDLNRVCKWCGCEIISKIRFELCEVFFQPHLLFIRNVDSISARATKNRADIRLLLEFHFMEEAVRR